MKNASCIKFFRDSNINGIEISKVESSRHVFPKHAHDDIYALSLITKGASYCLGREKSDLTVNTGQIVALNPGQVHSGIPVGDNSISYWMLYADIKAMKKFATDIFQQHGILPEFNRMVIKNPRLANKFKKLLLTFEHSRDSLEKETLISAFLSDLFKAACDQKPERASDCSGNKSIDLAKDVLSEDLDIGISLDTVAKKVGFSRFHFIRQFKKHTGISPHQFRIQQRIEAAKDLIRKGRPLSQIALETGFSDQSHFTNKFRQYTGATPSQYAHF